jgi:hypothetical protein
MGRPFVLPLKQAAIQLFARSLETSMAGVHFTPFPFIAGHRAAAGPSLLNKITHVLAEKPIEWLSQVGRNCQGRGLPY